MREEQWDQLKRCAAGEEFETPPVALIIDSPWLPGYLGISTLDYLTVPEVWLEANMTAAREFQDVIFVPGFWVEMGMGAEPSAFGCKVTFHHDRTPDVHTLTSDIQDLCKLTPPDPRRDGLLPIILNYYRLLEPRIKDAGHVLKIIAARGPLVLATHLLGVSEFLMAMKTSPEATHQLLRTTTRLVRTWLEAQAETLGDVEGILLLDDIVGFMSLPDYREFAHPYLREIFASFPEALKFFHNDTNNPVSFGCYAELGIRVLNFTHLQLLDTIRELVGPEMCLMGNVPPLDVLVRGTPEMVRQSVSECRRAHPSSKGWLLSAGGGTSPGTPGENIHALVAAARTALLP
ncbi:MAG: uroporphyrinogen decarboxylase family protein [Pirellulaceae bacterium]